jgi:hypothetical protein
MQYSQQQKAQTQNQSQNQSQSQTAVQNPWAPQAGYLTQGFENAANALGVANSTPAPNQFVSQFTPSQLGLFQNMVDYANGNTGIPASSAAAGGALTGAGSGAASNGLYGLAGFSPTTMSGVLSDANAAANDPSVQGCIDAALRDARRSVSEDVLPRISRNAAAGGNLNSSRTGVAEGIVQRGLADATADTSANIRGQAYSQGLQAALERAGAGDTARLGALTALTSGGINAANAGVGANTAAIGQQGGLFDIASGGVAGQQAGSQAAIDDALARYQFGVNSPFAGLNNFWNIVGSGNWGGSATSNGTLTGTGTGTATTTTTPSPMTTIGSLLGAAGVLGGPSGFGFFGTKPTAR